jgi:NAD-dependent dihydropyrimidine dehydrogenase PreA subunit
MSGKTFHDVPRNKIPWGPTVDYTKCVSCGKCVDYCKLGVYEFTEDDGKKKALVKNPNNCVVYCNGCDAVCPAKAISHPSKRETAKVVAQLRKTQKRSSEGGSKS